MQNYLAGAVLGKMPAVEQIIPMLRHGFDDLPVVIAKRRGLGIERRPLYLQLHAAVLLHLLAGQLILMLLRPRLFQRAGTFRRRRLFWRRGGGLWFDGIQITGRLWFLHGRFRRFGLRHLWLRWRHGRLKLGQLRHLLGFGHVLLLAVQLGLVRVAVGVRISRAGIFVGIILRLRRRLGFGVAHVHENFRFVILLLLLLLLLRQCFFSRQMKLGVRLQFI